MMQAWYNTTKEAILNAEKERKRKGLDVEQLKKELQEEEDCAKSSRVNVKKFSIESYESWKEDLMKCGEKSNLARKTSQETTAYGNSNSHPMHSLLSLTEEDELGEDATNSSLLLPAGQITTIEESLSKDDQRGLTKMEKATPIIQEHMMLADNEMLSQEDTKSIDI